MLQNLPIAAMQFNLLRDRLRAEDPSLDERTLADTVEGLSDLHEVIQAVLRAALEDEALASGLKQRVTAMQERMERLAERASKRRLLAREAMTECDIKKIIAPDFTASIRPGPAALVITDESQVPTEFWEPRPPRLNRQGLLAELKNGSIISGASLANPEPVLSVRTK